MPTAEASRRNLQTAGNLGKIKMWRSREETAIIKLLIWQSCFNSGPVPRQRALAHQLGISQPYIYKVRRKLTTVGFYQLQRCCLAGIQASPLGLPELKQFMYDLANCRDERLGWLRGIWSNSCGAASSSANPRGPQAERTLDQLRGSCVPSWRGATGMFWNLSSRRH